MNSAPPHCCTAMKEITLVTPPDRPGTLADITELLAARGVNITDMEVIDDHRHGIIRLMADPYDAALRALTEAGHHALSDEVILIRIKDEPGGRVAARFREPAINVNSLRILRRQDGSAIVALGTSDNALARTLLADCLV
jgi:hypothetical protein